MRNLSILIFLGILLCFPSTTGFASVALNDAPANHSHLIDKAGKLSKKERKRLARTKRWKKRKAYQMKNPNQKKDFTLGNFGILTALIFLFLLIYSPNFWYILLCILMCMVTAFVGISFLINSKNQDELISSKWKKFRHFGIGWLLFVWVSFAAVILFVITFTSSVGVGSAIASVAGISSIVIAAVALLLLVRGIIRALSTD